MRKPVASARRLIDFAGMRRRLVWRRARSQDGVSGGEVRRRGAARGGVAHFGQRAVEMQLLAGELCDGEAIEQQPHGQEFGETARRCGVNRPLGVGLHLPNHACPSAQRQQRCDDERFALVGLNAEQCERLLDGFPGRNILGGQSLDFGPQVAQPTWKHAARGAKVGEKRCVESAIPVGQRPMADALVQKCGAVPNENVVHEFVGVVSDGVEQRVAMPARSRAARGSRFAGGGPAMTDAPQQLQGKRLPGLVAPGFDRFVAKTLEQVRYERSQGGRRGVGSARRRGAEIAHDPASRALDRAIAIFRQSIAAKLSQRFGLGHDPTQLGGGRAVQRRLEHGLPQVKAGAQGANQLVRVLGEVRLQDGDQIVGPNAASGQLAAIARLGRVRLAAVDVRRLHHGVGERFMLKGVQRVVMHEDGQRTLRRQ